MIAGHFILDSVNRVSRNLSSLGKAFRTSTGRPYYGPRSSFSVTSQGYLKDFNPASSRRTLLIRPEHVEGRLLLVPYCTFCQIYKKRLFKETFMAMTARRSR